MPREKRAKYVGNLGPLYGSDFDWTGGFLKDCWGNFDGISEHWYGQPGRHLDIDKCARLPLDEPTDDAYVKVDQTLLQFARYPADIVHGEAEEWQGYQQRFPAMVEKNIFLSIDEYAYFSGRASDGLSSESQAGPRLRHDLQRDAAAHRLLTMAAQTTGVSTDRLQPHRRPR